MALTTLLVPGIQGAMLEPCRDLSVAKQLLRSDGSTGWARDVLRPHLDLPLWQPLVGWIHPGVGYLFYFLFLPLSLL